MRLCCRACCGLFAAGRKIGVRFVGAARTTSRRLMCGTAPRAVGEVRPLKGAPEAPRRASGRPPEAPVTV